MLHLADPQAGLARLFYRLRNSNQRGPIGILLLPKLSRLFGIIEEIPGGVVDNSGNGAEDGAWKGRGTRPGRHGGVIQRHRAGGDRGAFPAADCGRHCRPLHVRESGLRFVCPLPAGGGVPHRALNALGLGMSIERREPTPPFRRPATRNATLARPWQSPFPRAPANPRTPSEKPAEESGTDVGQCEKNSGSRPGLEEALFK